MWADANKALEEVNAPARPREDRNKYELVIKGLLRCVQCGNLMKPKPSGKKDSNGNPYIYYCCGEMTMDGKVSPCEIRNLPSRAFEEFVVKVIGEFGKHPEIIAATLEATKKECGKSIRPAKKRLAKTEADYAKAAAEMKTCAKAIAVNHGTALGEALTEEEEELAKAKSDTWNGARNRQNGASAPREHRDERNSGRGRAGTLQLRL